MADKAPSKPLVSVAMVVCNVDRFLAEAIESILNQTFTDFEFNIVDFGSTDRSKEIISSYAAKNDRIKLHEIPHCRLAEARNAACFLAQGKYIALMDADDVSLPDRLKWQVEFLEANPRTGVVGGQIEWIDATGATVAASVLHPAATSVRPCTNREIQAVLLEYCPFWEANLLRRDAFLKVGGYRPIFLQSEDYDLYMRIAEHYEMANLERVTFKYRMHSSQLSLRKRKQQTFCHLAVQGSAALRRRGLPDPVDSAEEITAELLTKLGIDEARQQARLADEYMGWVSNLSGAHDWGTALSVGVEMLTSCDWRYITKRQLSDMRLAVAEAYWKNHRFVMGATTMASAVILRPKLVGRPLRLLLQRKPV